MRLDALFHMANLMFVACCLPLVSFCLTYPAMLRTMRISRTPPRCTLSQALHSTRPGDMLTASPH
jgi:Lon protease-like protein